MNVLPVYMYIFAPDACLVAKGQNRVSDPLKPEVQAVVTLYAGAGN